MIAKHGGDGEVCAEQGNLPADSAHINPALCLVSEKTE
jgi:hypothetical protein